MGRNRVEFSYEKKGYSPEQVEEYIDHLLGMYENLEKDYSDLERKYHAVQAELEEAIDDEKVASKIVMDARKTADSIVEKANIKAKAIKDSVNAGCNEILDRYAQRAAFEREKLARVESAVAEFKKSLYRAYKEHIGIIDMIMPEADEKSERMSEATDEQLMDAAFELATKKYDESSNEQNVTFPEGNDFDAEDNLTGIN